MQPSNSLLKSEPESLGLTQHQHHQNYQINTNPDMYRHSGTVQLHVDARQYQSTSPIVPQQSNQRFDVPAKKRVYFTPEQRSQLEDLYKNQQYPTRDDKSNLAKSLNIDENKIQVWFQNRRARDRRPRCPRRKMRASHGFNTLNLIHNMAHASHYSPNNLFQNLNQHHHDQTGGLNPYATTRQFGLGYGMNIFAPNWPTQQPIQNTTASAVHHLQTQQGRTVLDGWNGASYTGFTGLNSRAASDNSFDGIHTPNDAIEQS